MHVKNSGSGPIKRGAKKLLISGNFTTTYRSE